jgi:hypothetical protein
MTTAATKTTHPAIIKAAEIWDRRDAATGHMDDLAPHEQVFLAAVHQIRGDCSRNKGDAVYMHGRGSHAAIEAHGKLDRDEWNDLDKAMAAYKEAMEEVA